MYNLLRELYLEKNILSIFIVFGGDARDWSPEHFVGVLHFSKLFVDQLQIKAILLADAGTYTQIRKNVEGVFFKNWSSWYHKSCAFGPVC